MDYNQTVHLPQTDFPMRAGLPKREPEMLQEMYDHDLYHKMVKRNEGKPTFVLHDGPPYANGNIHIGTALNKILKDMIVKHRNMTGWCAPYVPGWDTHGLPIESAVLKDKKVKRDEMTTAQFRTKCREYAESYIEKMTWACWGSGRTPISPCCPSLRPSRSRSLARWRRRASSTRA